MSTELIVSNSLNMYSFENEKSVTSKTDMHDKSSEIKGYVSVEIGYFLNNVSFKISTANITNKQDAMNIGFKKKLVTK